MNRFAFVQAALLAASLAACASGPKFSEAQSTLQPIPEGQGRVYFYRTQTMGAAVQPTIYLNGQKVGSCEPDGVFIKDVAPGRYEVVAGTESEHRMVFFVRGGDEQYVKCSITMGVFVGRPHLELVAPATGKADIQSLALTGA